MYLIHLVQVTSLVRTYTHLLQNEFVQQVNFARFINRIMFYTSHVLIWFCSLLYMVDLVGFVSQHQKFLINLNLPLFCFRLNESLLPQNYKIKKITFCYSLDQDLRLSNNNLSFIKLCNCIFGVSIL